MRRIYEYEGYIEELENELDKLVRHEDEANELNWEKEQAMHVLFENRKHAKCRLKELQEMFPHAVASTARADYLRPAT